LYRSIILALFSRVVVDVLDDLDHGLGAQPVPDGISARTILAFFGNWTGASERVAPIGFDLSNRGSWDGRSTGSDG
jgi:hypothetical protein